MALFRPADSNQYCTSRSGLLTWPFWLSCQNQPGRMEVLVSAGMKWLPPHFPVFSPAQSSTTIVSGSMVAQQSVPARPSSVPTQRTSTCSAAPRQPKITHWGWNFRTIPAQRAQSYRASVLPAPSHQHS